MPPKKRKREQVAPDGGTATNTAADPRSTTTDQQSWKNFATSISETPLMKLIALNHAAAVEEQYLQKGGGAQHSSDHGQEKEKEAQRMMAAKKVGLEAAKQLPILQPWLMSIRDTLLLLKDQSEGLDFGVVENWNKEERQARRRRRKKKKHSGGDAEGAGDLAPAAADSSSDSVDEKIRKYTYNDADVKPLWEHSVGRRSITLQLHYGPLGTLEFQREEKNKRHQQHNRKQNNKNNNDDEERAETEDQQKEPIVKAERGDDLCGQPHPVAESSAPPLAAARPPPPPHSSSTSNGEDKIQAETLFFQEPVLHRPKSYLNEPVTIQVILKALGYLGERYPLTRIFVLHLAHLEKERHLWCLKKKKHDAKAKEAEEQQQREEEQQRGHGRESQHKVKFEDVALSCSAGKVDATVLKQEEEREQSKNNRLPTNKRKGAVGSNSAEIKFAILKAKILKESVPEDVWFSCSSSDPSSAQEEDGEGGCTTTVPPDELEEEGQQDSLNGTGLRMCLFLCDLLHCDPTRFFCDYLEIRLRELTIPKFGPPEGPTTVLVPTAGTNGSNGGGGRVDGDGGECRSVPGFVSESLHPLQQLRDRFIAQAAASELKAASGGGGETKGCSLNGDSSSPLSSTFIKRRPKRQRTRFSHSQRRDVLDLEAEKNSKVYFGFGAPALVSEGWSTAGTITSPTTSKSGTTPPTTFPAPVGASVSLPLFGCQHSIQKYFRLEGFCHGLRRQNDNTSYQLKYGRGFKFITTLDSETGNVTVSQAPVKPRLLVVPSGIGGARFGVWLRGSVPKGTKLAEYGGVIEPISSEVLAAFNKEEVGKGLRVKKVKLASGAVGAKVVLSTQVPEDPSSDEDSGDDETSGGRITTTTTAGGGGGEVPRSASRPQIAWRGDVVIDAPLVQGDEISGYKLELEVVRHTSLLDEWRRRVKAKQEEDEARKNGEKREETDDSGLRSSLATACTWTPLSVLQELVTSAPAWNQIWRNITKENKRRAADGERYQGTNETRIADAKVERCLCSMINDAKGTAYTNNADFDNYGQVLTRRNIRDEEVFVSYGSAFKLNLEECIPESARALVTDWPARMVGSSHILSGLPPDPLLEAE